MVARIEQLAAKLAQKEAAMAALKKEVDEMKRTMAKAEAAKGAAAKEALATERQGETVKGKDGAESAAAGNAGKAGKAGDTLPAAHPSEPTNRIPFLDRYIEEHVDRVRSEYDSEVEGMKEQVEAVRREAADAVGALKAEIARMRAAAERQAAEVAYVRATAAHTEARMNDVELAVAEGKSAWEKERAERNQAGGAEVPEGKKRKRDEAVKAEGLALAAAGGCALIADRDGSDGKQDGGGMKSALSGLRAVVDGLSASLSDSTFVRSQLQRAITGAMSDGETVSEAAGGMEARVEQLAAKLAQQEEAMAALKSEVDELRRAVAQVADANGAEANVLEAKGANATGAEAEGAEAMRTEATGAAKGAAAKGALETGSHGETAKGKQI
ncbi:unnamed protein product [Closterium sp. Naga37s-1]|nr:unnamed protein product [Closterium sp. Naga37s-1]